MAARGRLHKDDSFSQRSDLDNAQSPLELGRLYGFSEDDIARFYTFHWHKHAIAYSEYVRYF
jgi:hypothetical protein